MMSIPKPVWWISAAVAAAALFVVAVRPEFYNYTTPRQLSHVLFGAGAPGIAVPWWLSLHVLLRKIYSLVAFAAIGFIFDRALGPSGRPRFRAAMLVAAFSLTIEIGQALIVPVEPFSERVTDILCGAVGGAFGASAALFLSRRRSERS